MKVLMDGRNHGAGPNSSNPCSTVCSINKGVCVNYTPCSKGGCGSVYIPVQFCWTVKVFGHNPKANA